jgi:hypothetical protein
MLREESLETLSMISPDAGLKDYLKMLLRSGQ